jgi:hypothetical protein
MAFSTKPSYLGYVRCSCCGEGCLRQLDSDHLRSGECRGLHSESASINYLYDPQRKCITSFSKCNSAVGGVPSDQISDLVRNEFINVLVNSGVPISGDGFELLGEAERWTEKIDEIRDACYKRPEEYNRIISTEIRKQGMLTLFCSMRRFVGTFSLYTRACVCVERFLNSYTPTEHFHTDSPGHQKIPLTYSFWYNTLHDAGCVTSQNSIPVIPYGDRGYLRPVISMYIKYNTRGVVTCDALKEIKIVLLELEAHLISARGRFTLEHYAESDYIENRELSSAHFNITDDGSPNMTRPCPAVVQEIIKEHISLSGPHSRPAGRS